MLQNPIAKNLGKLTVAGVGLLLTLNVALAAPTKVDLVYEATRNGQPFATITESYRAENGRYRIESITQGIGVYALFGQRILRSEGLVTAKGLKPARFELKQGDNEKKALYADFDWAASRLTMKVKGRASSVTLQKGAQDLSSFIYQFMFSPPEGKEFRLPVTTGKKLREYHYNVAQRGTRMQVPAGEFTTIHLTDADETASDDDKELWLGIEAHYLPVRLLMRDDNGAKIEQILTSVHAE